MAARRAFISFDYDHDEDIRVMLAGQAKIQLHHSRCRIGR